MILSRSILLLLPIVSSQIIDISLCSDTSCSKNCLSWRTNAGQCSVCVGGVNQCSVNNPSSITTSNSITLYSDSTCTNVIQTTSNIPITLDNKCHTFQLGGSYRAENVSLVIGLSVTGSLIFFMIVICCCVRLCGCCNKKPPTPQIPPSSNAIILDQTNKSVPDYFGNGQNGVQIYPTQHYEQPPYGQNNVYYPNNAYNQPNYYAPQNYTQPAYGNQPYYTPNYQPYNITVGTQPQPSAPPAPAYYDQVQRPVI
jgi:hypothetical protein